MKNLKDILYRTSIEAIKGSTDLTINKIEFDSRKVSGGDVFVAIKGTIADGHQYIQKCIEQGAVAIICEVFPEEIQDGITYIQVDNSHKALAFMAANYYDNPSEKLKLVGVTGTNGKTTIATLLYTMFENAGYKSGWLSTVKTKVHKTKFPPRLTPPDWLTKINTQNQLV